MSMTSVEVAQAGNKAQRRKYGIKKIREWGSLGGRPKGSKDKRPRLTKTRKQRRASKSG
jgi:hypothetical protein